MRKDLTISHELNDSKASISWPLLPMLAVLGLLGYARFASAGSAWLADSLAILLAYTLAQTGLCLSQKTAWLKHASQRWVVLVLFMLLALLAGIWIEAVFWPPLTASHAVWLLPAVLIVFVFATILPAAIDLEITHRTQASLAAEASKHNLERQMLEARLAALQGQIEPHFFIQYARKYTCPDTPGCCKGGANAESPDCLPACCHARHASE